MNAITSDKWMSTDELRFIDWLIRHRFAFSHPAITLKTRDGQQYTADFYVPELAAFIEIKPSAYAYELQRPVVFFQQYVDETHERIRFAWFEMGDKFAFLNGLWRPRPRGGRSGGNAGPEAEQLPLFDSSELDVGKKRESRIVPPKF